MSIVYLLSASHACSLFVCADPLNVAHDTFCAAHQIDINYAAIKILIYLIDIVYVVCLIHIYCILAAHSIDINHAAIKIFTLLTLIM